MKQLDRKNKRIFVILIGILLVTLLGALCIGRYSLSVGEVFQALLGTGELAETKQVVVWNVRMPRIIMAAAVGAGLGDEQQRRVPADTQERSLGPAQGSSRSGRDNRGVRPARGSRGDRSGCNGDYQTHMQYFSHLQRLWNVGTEVYSLVFDARQ